MVLARLFSLPQRRPGIALFARVAIALLLAVLLVPASADDAGVASTAADHGRFAVVKALRGQVEMSLPNVSAVQLLAVGDAIPVGARLRTAAGGELLLKTDDAALMALRPNAELVVSGYRAEGRAGDHMLLSLVKGGLRVISGWIAGLNREEYLIRAPVATIGVRGTDHEPYVLLEAIEGPSSASLPGVYDFVRSGETLVSNDTGSVSVAAGKVAFVPIKPRQRGLLTLLLPRLLETVPGFYVGGAFDAEMDAYASASEVQKAEALAVVQASKPPTPSTCTANRVSATAWLGRFDAAVQARDAASVLALFAEQVQVSATVFDAQGQPQRSTLNRQDLADSAIAAVVQLSHYQQQRLNVKVTELPAASGEACARLALDSDVVEQGRLAEKPYRLESQEHFVLAWQGGEWLAVEASAVQR